jgi:hypothetical protein
MKISLNPLLLLMGPKSDIYTLGSALKVTLLILFNIVSISTKTASLLTSILLLIT